MGRQIGGMKFSGSVGDLNFYYTKDNGWLVRQKSTLNAKRFRTDPVFERARENGKNFGGASSSAKLFRDTFRPLWFGISDSKLCPRSVSLLHKVRKYDGVSARGQRKTGIALEHAEARALFKGFSFQAEATVSRILQRDFTTDISTGSISIEGLVPGEDLKKPRSATHVGFTAALGRIDFGGNGAGTETFEGETGTLGRETGCILSLRCSDEHILQLDGTATDVVLQPEASTDTEGIGLLVLKIVFYQERNGALYLLNEARFQAVEVVDVD